MNAVGQHGDDTAEFSNGRIGDMAQLVVTLHVRDQRHHFDLSEVDAQTNARATAECRQPQYSTGYSQPARRIRHSGWDNAGPECHSPHDLVTGHATYNPRTIQMEGGASNMSDPLGRRDQRV